MVGSVCPAAFQDDISVELVSVSGTTWNISSHDDDGLDGLRRKAAEVMGGRGQYERLSLLLGTSELTGARPLSSYGIRQGDTISAVVRPVASRRSYTGAL